MAVEALLALVLAHGFTQAKSLMPQTLRLRPEVRAMCRGNACGQYGRRWSCPPGCGTLEECRARIAGYRCGMLVQTTGPVEDSFDIEAMQALEQRHKRQFLSLYEALRAKYPRLLALGVGCCTRCAQCTFPDAPCRFPASMLSSMEAYGILVTEVCRENGLAYYYGQNTMTYTGCFLLA